MFFYELSHFQLWYMVHNKQLELTAWTVFCTLLFCIAKCSMNLVGSTVVVLVPCYNGECGKSLCTRRFRWLNITVQLYIKTKRPYVYLKCSIEQQHQTKPKRQLLLYKYASKLQFVCISAPITGQEVCQRLWSSLSTKILHTVHSLISSRRFLRIDKDSIVCKLRKSDK